MNGGDHYPRTYPMWLIWHLWFARQVVKSTKSVVHLFARAALLKVRPGVKYSSPLLNRPARASLHAPLPW